MKPSFQEIRRRSTAHRIRMAQEPRKRRIGQTMFCNVCGQQPASGVHNGVPWRQCNCDPYPSDPTPEDIPDFMAHVVPLPLSPMRYRETSETAHIICDGNELFLDEDIFRLPKCDTNPKGGNGWHRTYRPRSEHYKERRE